MIGPEKSELRKERNRQTLLKARIAPAALSAPKAPAARPEGEALIRPLQLGPLTVSVPMLLSPMAGVTNWPFRVLCQRFGGGGMYVAEMITSRALIAGNEKAFQLLSFSPEEKIRSLQLYGVNPKAVYLAAKIVLDKVQVDHIGLNFGCPVPKITRRGGGSALPWKYDLFAKVVGAAKKALEGSPVALTAKIRTGIDEDHKTYIEAGKIAQEEGADGVILHARTCAQYYGGHSRWAAIGELKRELSIPVIGNGDVFSGTDAVDMMRETGCDAVAVGRGSQGRPWLFSDIAAAFSGEDQVTVPPLGKVASCIKEHFSMMVDFMEGDEERGARAMRSHLGWYLRGYPIGGEARSAIMQSGSREGLFSLLDGLDPALEPDEDAVTSTRGRNGFQKKVHLPYGWLDSHSLTEREEEALFGLDVLDASY
ncbi:MAG: tRNA dihydrouridine synthase DusB [Aeriscardovia sp.]|nr:tRNA dihydrouridine synthase DusB [Aeriscardovia sp.]